MTIELYSLAGRAVVGAGLALVLVLAPARAQAWHEYNVAFDTWLPLR